MNDLDALWAFLVAAAVALVLTPVAARLAQPRRRDRPAARARPARRARRRASAAWRSSPACWPRGLSSCRGPETRGILAGAAAIALVGAVDDAKPGGLHPGRQARGPVRRGARSRSPATCASRTSRCRSSTRSTSATGAIPLTLVGIVAVMNVVNFTDGVDGLAAGRLHDRGGHVRGHRAVARPRRRRDPRGGDRRRRGGLPAPQLPPGLGLHGGLRLEPARAAAGLRRDPGRAEDGRRRGAVLPAGDPRGARARRDLRGGQADQVPPAGLLGRHAGTSTTASRTSASRSGARCSTSTPGPSSLAALALAMRFVPYSDDDGSFNAGWALVIAAFGAARARRERLPRLRARDPQVPPLPRAPAAPRSRRSAARTRSRRRSSARSRPASSTR